MVLNRSGGPALASSGRLPLGAIDPTLAEDARERLAELERRLVQLAEDVQRERALVADAEATLERLSTEEETLKQEVQGIAQTRTGVDRASLDAGFAQLQRDPGRLDGEEVAMGILHGAAP